VYEASPEGPATEAALGDPNNWHGAFVPIRPQGRTWGQAVPWFRV
jgi:hypothetical protein